jgi:hypothetical protein
MSNISNIQDFTTEQYEDEIDIKDLANLWGMECLPESILGIPREQFTSSIGNARDILSTIIPDKSRSWEDRTTASIYLSKIVGNTTQKERTKLIKLLEELLKESQVPIDKRYRFFFSTDDYKFNGHIVQELHLFYFMNFPDPIIYKVLSAGYILEYKKISPDIRSEIEQYLFDIGNNPDLTVKVEALDILLRVGFTQYTRDLARKEIERIGTSQTPLGMDIIYMNSQNAHNKTIVDSAFIVLRRLMTEDYKSVNITQIYERFVETKSNLNEKKFISEKDLTTFKDSLGRLLVDSSRFDGYKLSTILLAIWKKINGNPMLENRLFEEILESKDTCSTGYLVRLMNIFSGTDIFGETISISVEDELKSAVFARLSSILRKSGEVIRSQIALEIMEKDINNKPTLLEFVETYSPEDELYEEYKNLNLISKEQFKICFDKAIKAYCGIQEK